MKTVINIGILAILLLFSCSKEQTLQPINSMENQEPSMFIISTDNSTKTNGDNTDTFTSNGKKGNKIDNDITDPEKDDGKGKTNKKSKN